MALQTNYLRIKAQNETGRTNEQRSWSKFWKNIQINEWTFSVFLLVFSLGFVAGKLFVNYAFSGRYDVFSAPNLRKVSNFGRDHLDISSEGLMSLASLEYGDEMNDMIFGITHRFGWLFRAASSGFAVMSFSWFILYKDSSIPGVNPPSPFSPSKKRYPENSRLQINYLMGVLIAVLVFVHMCL